MSEEGLEILAWSKDGNVVPESETVDDLDGNAVKTGWEPLVRLSDVLNLLKEGRLLDQAHEMEPRGIDYVRRRLQGE